MKKPPRRVEEFIEALTTDAPLPSTPRTYTPLDPNNDFGDRIADMGLEPVPLEYFTSTSAQCAWDCHVAPHLPATILFHLAQYGVSVTDRTGYPIANVTVEIHGQSLGVTDSDGKFLSGRFTPGSYPLKFRSPHTTPSGPPGPIPPGWEHGWEYEIDTAFDVGLLEGTCELALLAQQISNLEVIEQMFGRTLKKLPAAILAQVEGVFTPESAKLFAALLLLWLAGHLDGVSVAVDAAVVIATVGVTLYTIDLTLEAIDAIIHMVRDLCRKLARCRDEFDLDDAAKDFADLIAFAGIGILFEIVARIVKHVTGKITYRPSSKYIGPRQPASMRFKRCIELMGASAYAERARLVLAKARSLEKYARLSDTQIVAIRAYTDAMVTKLSELRKDWVHVKNKDRRPYKDWQFVNRLLRQTDTPITILLKRLVSKTTPDLATFKECADYVDTMVEAVEALPPQRATVFRVVDLASEGVARQLRLWTPVIEKGFMSTSANEEMITRSWSAAKEKPAILKIMAWSGRSIDDISAFPGQEEILIPPGRKFLFVAKRRVRILREKTENVGDETVRVRKPKLRRGPEGSLVPEMRWNDETGQLEPVMEQVLEEVEAVKYYGVELGDDLIIRVFGADDAFRTLVNGMRIRQEHDHADEPHP